MNKWKFWFQCAVFTALVATTCVGCGSQSVQLTELLPDVELGRTPDGCVRVEVTQPLPAPDGWTVTTTTEVEQIAQPDGCASIGGEGSQ